MPEEKPKFNKAIRLVQALLAMIILLWFSATRYGLAAYEGNLYTDLNFIKLMQALTFVTMMLTIVFAYIITKKKKYIFYTTVIWLIITIAIMLTDRLSIYKIGFLLLYVISLAIIVRERDYYLKI